MSRVFHVTAPDGHTLEITGPPDATEEQAIAEAQRQYKPDTSLDNIHAQQVAKFPTAHESNPAVKIGSITPAKNVFAPDENTLINAISGFGRGVSSIGGMMAAGLKGDVPSLALNAGMAAASEAGKAVNIPRSNMPLADLSEKVGRYAASALPLVGPWAANLGERAGSGDIAGAVSELGTTIGAPEAIRFTPKILPTEENLMSKAATIRNLGRSATPVSNEIPVSKPGMMRAGIAMAARPIASALEVAAQMRDNLNPPPKPMITTQPVPTNAKGAPMRRVQIPPTNDLLDLVRQQAMQNAPQDFETRTAGPRQDIPMPESLAPTPRTGVTTRDIETAQQSIRPAGLARRSTMFNTPKLLAEVPELVGARGEAFDTKLTDAFNKREQSVIQAEALVPRETTIPNPAAQLEKIQAEYAADPHLQMAASKLQKLVDKWKEFPDQVPWEQFRDAKRSFFDENSTKSAPLREAYRVLMDSASGASPELAQANQKYSVVRRAMDDANMETANGPHRGTRIKEVGKVPKPTALEKSSMQDKRLPPL